MKLRSIIREILKYITINNIIIGLWAISVLYEFEKGSLIQEQNELLKKEINLLREKLKNV